MATREDAAPEEAGQGVVERQEIGETRDETQSAPTLDLRTTETRPQRVGSMGFELDERAVRNLISLIYTDASRYEDARTSGEYRDNQDAGPGDASSLSAVEYYRRYLPRYVLDIICRNSAENTPPQEYSEYKGKAAVLFADITNFVSISQSIKKFAEQRAVQDAHMPSLEAGDFESEPVDTVLGKATSELSRRPSGKSDLLSGDDDASSAHAGEAVKEMLTRYFEKLTDLILDHGGDVLKFAGDALIAVWAVDTKGDGSGAKDLRDATLSALACCFEVQNEMDNFDSGFPDPDSPERRNFLLRTKLSVAAGGTTFLCAGGSSNRWEFVVTGDTLRQLEKVTGFCQPSQILVSGQAARECLADVEMSKVVHDKTGRPITHEETEGCQLVLAPPALSKSDSARLANIRNPELKDSRKVVQHLSYFLPNVVRSLYESGLNESVFDAENRVISVMFVSYNGIPWQGGDCGDILHRCLRASQPAVFRNGGFLRQFLVEDKGVTLIAGFGVGPLVNDSRTARCAVRAAVMLREAIEALDCGVTVSIGITTGNAHVGNVGSNRRCEYSMTGDVVNLAARIMARGKVAQIASNVLVDKTTYLRARAIAETESYGEHMLKGLTQPMNLHAIKKLRPDHDDDNAASDFDSKDFVGRSEEVKRVTEILDEAPSTRLARCVLVEAEMGMGKSAFLRHIHFLSKNRKHHVVYSRGSVLKSESPLYAWRSVLLLFFAGETEREGAMLVSKTTGSKEKQIQHAARRIFHHIDAWLKRSASEIQWPAWSTREDSMNGSTVLFAGTIAQRTVGVADSTNAKSSGPSGPLVSDDSELAGPHGDSRFQHRLSIGRLSAANTMPILRRQSAEGGIVSNPVPEKRESLFQTMMKRRSRGSVESNAVGKAPASERDAADREKRSNERASQESNTETDKPGSLDLLVRPDLRLVVTQRSRYSKDASIERPKPQQSSHRLRGMYDARLKMFAETKTHAINGGDGAEAPLSDAGHGRASTPSSDQSDLEMTPRTSSPDLRNKNADTFSATFMRTIGNVRNSMKDLKVGVFSIADLPDSETFGGDGIRRRSLAQESVDSPDEISHSAEESNDNVYSDDASYSGSHSSEHMDPKSLDPPRPAQRQRRHSLAAHPEMRRPVRRASLTAVFPGGDETRMSNVVKRKTGRSNSLVFADRRNSENSAGLRAPSKGATKHNVPRKDIPLVDLVPLFGSVLDMEWEDTEATALIEGDLRARCASDMILLLIKFFSESPEVFSESPEVTMALGEGTGSGDELHRGVCLIFDDVQHVDPESIRLMVRMGSVVRNLALFVGMRTANEYLPLAIASRYSKFLGHRTLAIRMDSMTREDVALLCSSALQAEVSDEVVEYVWSKCNSAPLVAREVINVMSERKYFVFNDPEDEDGKRTCILRDVANLNVLEVPSGSFRDMLKLRIDALVPTARQVLKIASVLGSCFHISTLVSVLPPNLSKRKLTSNLSMLCKLGILTQIEGDANVYEFMHELTRSLVYAMMPPLTCQRVHKAVAVYMEILESSRLKKYTRIQSWLQHVRGMINHWRDAQDNKKARQWLSKAMRVNYFTGNWPAASSLLAMIKDLVERSSMDAADTFRGGSAKGSYPGNEDVRGQNLMDKLYLLQIRRQMGQCTLRSGDLAGGRSQIIQALTYAEDSLGVAECISSAKLRALYGMCEFRRSREHFNEAQRPNLDELVSEALELASGTLRPKNAGGRVRRVAVQTSPRNPNGVTALDRNPAPSRAEDNDVESGSESPSATGRERLANESTNWMPDVRSRSERSLPAAIDTDEALDEALIGSGFKKLDTRSKLQYKSFVKAASRTSSSTDSKRSALDLILESPSYLAPTGMSVPQEPCKPRAPDSILHPNHRAPESCIVPVLQLLQKSVSVDDAVFGPRTFLRELFLVVYELFAVEMMATAVAITPGQAVAWSRLLVAIARAEGTPGLRALALGCALLAVTCCRSSGGLRAIRKVNIELQLCSLVQQAQRGIGFHSRWVEEVQAFLYFCAGTALLNNGFIKQAMVELRDFTSICTRCHLLHWGNVASMNLTYALSACGDAESILVFVNMVELTFNGLRAPAASIRAVEMLTYLNTIRALMGVGQLPLVASIIESVEADFHRMNLDSNCGHLMFMESYALFAKASMQASTGNLWDAMQTLDHAVYDLNGFEIIRASTAGVKIDCAAWALQVLFMLYKKLIEIRDANAGVKKRGDLASYRVASPEKAERHEVANYESLQSVAELDCTQDRRPLDLPTEHVLKSGIDRGAISVSVISDAVSPASIEDQLSRVEAAISDVLVVIGDDALRSLHVKWLHDGWRCIFAMMSTHRGAIGGASSAKATSTGCACISRMWPRRREDPFVYMQDARDFELLRDVECIQKSKGFRLPADPHGALGAIVKEMDRVGREHEAAALCLDAGRFELDIERKEFYMRMAASRYESTGHLQRALVLYNYIRKMAIAQSQ